MLFGKNRDSEIGLWLPNCTRCARTILLTTANFRTQFFPNSTTDPPITYTNYRDALSRILCYYYYPPCGNTTHFQPLNAVCEDTCVNITTKLCPGEWGVALQLVEPNAADLAATGLTFLDCGNPGLYLDPIPHCCSNTGKFMVHVWGLKIAQGDQAKQLMHRNIPRVSF